MHRAFSTNDLQALPELSRYACVPDVKTPVKYLQGEEPSVYLNGNEHTKVTATASLSDWARCILFQKRFASV